MVRTMGARTGLKLLWLSLPFQLIACDSLESSVGAEFSGGMNGVAGDSGGSIQIDDSGGRPWMLTQGGSTGLGGGAQGGNPAAQCGLNTSCEPGADADPGAPVAPELDSAQNDQVEQLRIVSSGGPTSAQDLSARYPSPFQDGIDYDATQATGLALVQGSSLKLDEAELAGLAQHGFVISERERFPNFVYGYKTFYALDLPLFVSADSVLYAVHQSFDSILQRIELLRLIPALTDLLTSMRAKLPQAGAGFSDQAVADIDLYLSVAASLLQGAQQKTVAGADGAEVTCLLNAVAAQQGCVELDLFGTSRVFDFSQFTPRGHYSDSPELTQYFQAMIWLGRTDFRLIETQADGSQVFRRRQLEGSLLLRQLIDADGLALWTQIDQAVGAFVGQHDNMILPELDQLLSDLGKTNAAQLTDVDDATIAQTLIAKQYGAQRILSQIVVSDAKQTLPLSSIFELFGQRYIVDSHVFSNVVFDRVNEDGYPPRMLPNPLDVAFAALGNNQAGKLLQPELEKYGYAPDLGKMRALVDAHPSEYWQANLYNHWLSALRALSTAREAQAAASVGLPKVAGTEAWGRRLLNTQLASWSELRHDTLLYAKQSYTTGLPSCEYPDAYVEPYPQFWKGLVDFAEYGRSLSETLQLSTSAPEVGAYFDKLGRSAATLQHMAENQRTGAPHSADDLAFINQAVRLAYGGGCGGSPDGARDAVGWYADLFFDSGSRVEYDPNIADVHTEPTDEDGNTVGHVLHVGTGMARLMVVTADNCGGPRAYVGLASSYFERTTDNFDRLTDEKWAGELATQTPPDVPWMTDLVVR